MKELIQIQRSVRVPKANFNSFGKYNYRSLEQILSIVKPYIFDNGCTITFNDDIISMNGGTYIKSTATITNEEGESVSATAFAREDAHKGMSAEQCSGSASSYARKYAICSLLAVDDSQDIDSLDNSTNEPKNSVSAPNSEDRKELLKQFCSSKKKEGVNTAELKKFYEFYTKPDSSEPTKCIIETRRIFDLNNLWKRWMEKV